MLKLCLVLLLSASVLSESVSPSEKVPELRGSASFKLGPEMAPLSAVNEAPQLGDVSSASVQRVPPLRDSIGLGTEPNDGSVG